MILTGILLITVLVSHVNATPYRVELDVSSLAGLDFELEFDLYDNNDVVGDSYFLIDNLYISNTSGMLTPLGMTDFEDGTLQGFDDSLNPDSVNVVSGGFTGIGSYVLRMDEDPFVTPTITFKDYLASDATTLQFDFEYFTTGVSGIFGLDSFVVSILNPVTLNPLMPGLTGMGDFLEANYNSIDTSAGVIVTEITSSSPSPIPEPSTLMLLLSSLSGATIFKKFFKRGV